ncbi:histidine kinase [Aureimonas sp. SA4125]|uniref:sensor histidine kinase n=1 Tax=Aureimonas sp. SA4125 TaxID=2826993 RepID=UPI001CC7B041|nr:sensor histidine kinase [Aureimonas sp. SA4125]BDA83899.1 histidine kinase [Aureimonas sp. SA4125]
MKMPDRLSNRSILVILASGFFALIVAVGAAIWGLSQSQEISRLVSHTYEVEQAILDFRGLTERAESARRGYLLDPADDLTQTLEDTVIARTAAMDRIGSLTGDNPVQTDALARLRDRSAAHLDEIKRSVALRQSSGQEAARAAFAAAGRDTLNELRMTARGMSEEERRLLIERSAEQKRGIALSYVLLAASGLLLIFVTAVTSFALRQNFRDVKTSRDQLRALNDNLETAVLARTADLQRANDEIQRFAYIVSHDLRSPLVNVMGFTSELDAVVKPLSELIEKVEAESPSLVTEEVRQAVVEDLPEAIGFIRSSTQKMDRLINAILRLSREGRRVITPEPLDVGEMLDGIVDSLQHRLTEVGAEVAVEKPMPKVVSDRVAIEQILSNLVENAVKYLKPGRPGRVVVRGRRSGNRLIYEIADNGRGIDPKDHERIFDLFRRSGTQDQPGEGIGLAHVRALAYRLGGTISCESSLGEGATFRLSLPPQFQPIKESRK